MREQRTSVLPEVEGIEVVSMGLRAVSQLRLEEIVVITMEIENGLRTSFVGRPTDERADNASFVIISHLDSALLIGTTQDVVHVLCLCCEEAKPCQKAYPIESSHTCFHLGQR